RRLHAEMPDAAPGEILQHGPVVAADLHHEGVPAAEMALAYPFRVAGEMLDHAPRGAGEEGVVAVEHLLRRRLVDDLEGAATAAEGGAQLVEIFLAEPVGRQEGVGDRHGAEAHEGRDRLGAEFAARAGSCAVWHRRNSSCSGWRSCEGRVSARGDTGG